jgi:RNA polymerase sigma factor for flagellar operon FliA
MTTPTNDTHALPADVAARMIPRIHRIARHIARRLPRHIRVDDLVGAGCQGLVSAYARFDASRGEEFEAFAELRIRGAMLDELRAVDPLSRDQRANARRMAAATHALHARLGRAPAADEIAAELGITLEEYWERTTVAASGGTTSLDDEDAAPRAQIHDRSAEPADELLSRKEEREAIRGALSALPPRLRRVLELYYGEGLTLRQIGDMLGVTESRISQLQTEAVRRIRELCTEPAAARLALAA